jgi:drug/metabolite transporter (DMT)-like permease
MKIGLETLTPYQVASLRMISAGLVMLPFAISALKKIPNNKVGLIFVSGLIGNFFPAFLFCIAEIKVDASLAGILNALTPLFTIIVGVMFFNTQVSTNRYIGVIVGFIGLALLFISRGNITLSYLSFACLIILATILYGINVNIVGRSFKTLGSLNIVSLAFSMLIPLSLFILWITGYFQHPLTAQSIMRSTGASGVLGIFGTALASILFYVLVKRAGGLFASTVTYGIPFVAVFIGIASGETITLPQIICLGIILAGVYLANKVDKKSLAPQPERMAESIRST